MLKKMKISFMALVLLLSIGSVVNAEVPPPPQPYNPEDEAESDFPAWEADSIQYQAQEPILVDPVVASGDWQPDLVGEDLYCDPSGQCGSISYRTLNYYVGALWENSTYFYKFQRVGQGAPVGSSVTLSKSKWTGTLPTSVTWSNSWYYWIVVRQYKVTGGKWITKYHGFKNLTRYPMSPSG